MARCVVWEAPLAKRRHSIRTVSLIQAGSGEVFSSRMVGNLAQAGAGRLKVKDRVIKQLTKMSPLVLVKTASHKEEWLSKRA